MAVKWIEKEELSSPESPEADSAILAASWILYKLSGERYPGTSTQTEWYGLDINRYTTRDYGASSLLTNLSLFEVEDYLSGHLRPRKQPVRSISSVSEGNASVAPNTYFLVNNSTIVKTDGTDWDFAEGVTITYTSGILPPEMGRRAARRLANEFIWSVENDELCALPERAKSFSRQGISYTILDPQEYLDKGKVGIYEIDLFLSTANPSRAKKRPKVFSPDLPKGRKTNI